MRKSQITGFLLLLFYIGKFIFCQKIYIWKTQFVLLHLHYRFFTQQVIGNAVTPTPIQIFIGFVDAILRSKILGNRLGILTQILIAMDYFFFFMFQIITFNLEKNKSICKGKFLIHPIQVTGSTYCGIVFQTMYTSKICT